MAAEFSINLGRMSGFFVFLSMWLKSQIIQLTFIKMKFAWLHMMIGMNITMQWWRWWVERRQNKESKACVTNLTDGLLSSTIAGNHLCVSHQSHHFTSYSHHCLHPPNAMSPFLLSAVFDPSECVPYLGRPIHHPLTWLNFNAFKYPTPRHITSFR